MKKVIFAVLALPLLAGCFWNKKADVVETSSAQDVSNMVTEETDVANKLMDHESDEK